MQKQTELLQEPINNTLVFVFAFLSLQAQPTSLWVGFSSPVI